MSDVNYNVNATVTGGEDVDKLADNMERIGDDAAITIDGTGVTETAEGLESISGTTADTKLDDVGAAAQTSASKTEVAAGAFKNMVAAIGLINIATAGAELAINAVKERLEAMSRIDAWNDAQVEGYKEAVLELGAGLGAIGEHLAGIAGQDFEQLTGLFGLGGGSTLENPAASFGALGISISEVMAVVEGGEPELDAMRDRLEEVGLGADVTGAQMGFLESQQSAYHSGVAEGAAQLAFYAESQGSANRALQEMLTNRDPMASFTSEWDLLKESMADGSIDTTAAANALNTLTSELGLSTEEVLALAQAQIDEGVAGALSYAEAIGSVDFQAAELAGATSAFAAYTTEAFAAGNAVQAIEAAYAGFSAAVGDGAVNLDVATEAGAAQQDALEGLAGVVDGRLAAAYDAADGSQAAFLQTASVIGFDVMQRLTSDLNLTASEAEAVAAALGLTQGDYEARFALAGAAEAQLQLGLLQGAIQGLPPAVELSVNTLITQGDYVGARDEVADYYAGNPVPITTEADTSGAEDGIAEVTDAEHPTTIEATAETAKAAADLLDTASEPRQALIIAVANNQAASAALGSLTNLVRTAEIDVATGSIDLPTNGELAARIGTVRVPIVAYWTTRVEGSRPR